MDAPAIVMLLGKEAALEALSQFEGKNICDEDVEPLYSHMARAMVFELSDAVLSDIIAGTDPTRWDLTDADREEEQRRKFTSSWREAEGRVKDAILAWYVLRSEAHDWVIKIRGHVPASWDEVNW